MRQRVTSQRIDTAMRGCWLDLYLTKSTRLEHLQARISGGRRCRASASRSCCDLAQSSTRGSVTAWSLSRSSGLAPLHREHVSLAEKKLRPHACEASAILDPVQMLPWSPSDDMYKEATGRLKAGKCLGPHGWRHETWSMMARSNVVGPLLLRYLRVWPHLTHPVKSLYSVQRLMLLKKPDASLRPILVGTIARKICHSAVYLIMKQDLIPHIASHQYMVLDRILKACPAAQDTWATWLQRTLASDLQIPLSFDEQSQVMRILEGMPEKDPLSALLFRAYVSLTRIRRSSLICG